MTDQVSPDNRLDHEVAGTLTENGRRRFVRGAGVGVTAIVTLAPRSSLAGSCLSPSASASINLLHSRADRMQETCSGKSPGFWGAQKHRNVFNATGAGQKRFGDTFWNPSNLSELSFLQVLQNGNGENSVNGSLRDSDELGAHLVAAWCNWKSGRVPATVLDEIKLKAMSEYAISGYEPTPGAPLWYGSDIVRFIQSTFG